MTERRSWWTSSARLVAGAAGFSAALGYCAWRLVRPGPRGELAHEVAGRIARWTCGASAIGVEVIGAEHLEASQPCVYVANHQSYLDYPILARVFPPRTVVVGKREVAQIPVVGMLFRAAGQWFIDRDDRRASSATLEALAELMRRDRTSVWFFPEGTRNKGAELLLPFKSGAFRLAAAAGVPVVPIVLSRLRPGLDLERRRMFSGSVRIEILAPSAPAVAGEEDALRAATRERMWQVLARATGRVHTPPSSNSSSRSSNPVASHD